MFKAHAGEDLLDQLRFMADAGFTAFEDNGLMKRPVAVQEAIGKTLAQLNMTMGVFVIDAGDNWKVSYATGKPEFKEPFLKACRDAVGHGQAREREVGHRGAGLLRAKPADRHPDRARDRHPQAGRRHPGAGQPDDGARAAERQPGSVPALRRIRPT